MGRSKDNTRLQDDFNRPEEETKTSQSIKNADYSFQTKDVPAFTSIVNFSTYPDDFLIINDIYFTGVPTTSINFESNSDAFIAETLRTPAPITSSEGREDFVLSLSLVFKPGKEQRETLRRLIGELSRHPFAFIYNNRIKKALNFGEFETTIFALETANIRSTGDSVGVIALDLTFHLFDYKPFSNHFYYNARLAGETLKQTESTNHIDMPIKLGEMIGYESSEYNVLKYVQQVEKDIENSIASSKTRELNIPVNFPSQSAAWMHYANKLCSEELIPKVFTGEGSDFIGFSVEEFQVLSPPPEARDGYGNAFKFFNEKEDRKEWIYPWKVDGSSIEQPTKTYQEQETDFLSNSVGEKTKIINTKTGASVSLDLSKVTNQTVDELNSLWRVGKYSNAPYVKHNAVVQLAKVAQSFPGRPIRIISASRIPTLTHSQGKHGEGLAIDLKVDGISNEKVFSKLKNTPKMGLGYYPNSTFVHVDYREMAYYWIDLSGPGDKSDYIPKNQREEWLRSNLATDKDKKEAGDSEEFDIKYVNDSTEELRKIQLKIENKKKAIDNSQNQEAKNKAQYEYQEVLKESRELWIKNQEANGWSYYYEDANVRNVFSKTLSVAVSGDYESQRHGKILPGIVCSAVSVTFGHRIAPIKFSGQRYNSYQFLGAGNKMGQIVLTFAGEEGKKSADIIKEIISKAKKNAQVFGSVIKEAGSIKLSSLSFDTGEQNVILALSNIESIIVTKFQESSTSDSPNKFQLALEFVSQDFSEELYEKKFAESLDHKKQVINSLMKLVKPKRTTKNNNGIDMIGIVPDPNIVKFQRAGFGETQNSYIYGSNVPAWLAEVVIKVSQLCTEVNNRMPPSEWKTEDKLKTWKDVYAEWGADKVMLGLQKNISQTDSRRKTKLDDTDTSVNRGTIYQRQTFIDPKEIEDDGPKTNELHSDIFKEWLNKMSVYVTEVMNNAGDKENFENYFGSIGKDILEAVSGGLGECYNDLFLPIIPNTDLAFQPEFYVYDDSTENPLVAGATDRANLELLLKRQVENELSSIQHYMKDAYLGGSYLSKNLPKILENRKLSAESMTGELEFLDNYHNMIIEGSSTWEPIYYREDSSISNNSQVLEWKQKVAKGLGGGSVADQQVTFMNNLIGLSSYLRDGRKWEIGIGDSTSVFAYSDSDKSNLVSSIYGEASDNISFGPNQEYLKVDAAINGEAAKEITSITQSVQSYPWEDQQTMTNYSPNKNVTIDSQTVVQGSPEIEDEGFLSKLLNVKDFFGNTTEDLLKIAEFVLNPVGGAIRKAEEAISDLENSLLRATVVASSSSAIQNIKKSEVAESISKLAAGIALGNIKNDITLRRAFPTFKIYFIEEDGLEDTESVGGEVRRAFDDFYSYSAVQEIVVTRSRKIASDLAVIRITNIGGKLFRRRFGQKDYQRREERNYEKRHYQGAKTTGDAGYSSGSKFDNSEKQGIFAETEKENPFERLVLQDGVKVQIRLGYSQAPDQLESVFLGQVVEIQPAEDGRIIEITCQGYGAELEAVELGPLEDGPVFYSSQQILSGSIIQESIVNFGRQSKFNRFNPAEMRHAWTGGTATWFQNWSDKKMNEMFNQYTFLNEPQDDNIYAPPPSVYSTAWTRFWNNACIYRPLKQTPWQIFQEHELRHPGHVSLAVPYGHSSRMTMFFGAKSQHYWRSPPSSLEVYLTENNYNDLLRSKGAMNIANGVDARLRRKLVELAKSSPDLAKAALRDIATNGAPNNVNLELGKQFGRYVPFRNYHYFDSEHHILRNEIRTSVDGTFNEIELLYFEDEGDLEDSDEKDLMSSIDDMRSEQDGFLTTKLDENIPDSSIRSIREEYPSCVTLQMAKRYTQGLFARYLRDAYKGELIVAGKETLKPYDVANIADSTLQMYGPIEVESVTHVFNRDNGFISIITPDLCVDVNDMFSASVFDVACAANSYVSYFSKKEDQLPPNPFSFISHLGMAKLISWTQDGDPVVVNPLSFQGRPFISNVVNPRRASLFLTLYGKWNQYWDDLGDAWNKMDIAETFLDTRLDISKKLLGWLGTGSQGGVR